MRNYVKISVTGIIAVIFSALAVQAQNVEGAWSMKNGSTNETLVLVDGYLSHSVFDLDNKKFISTRGGHYRMDNNQLVVEWQYDTDKAAQEGDVSTWLGQESRFSANMSGNSLQSNLSDRGNAWTRVDSNEGAMSGIWRMSGRKQGEEISSTPLRDRRTLKILSGNRFQWVAINIATGQFSGTGGGTYTFENGKYTENIEFFSRDDSRVGASLGFDGKIDQGSWHHSGNSSTGNPIYEIWSKLEQ